MAKRHLLTFLALVMLSFNAFSQQSQELEGQGTEQNPYLIQSLENFNYFRLSGDKSKYYKQTADINLSDLGQKSAAIISSFSGTYDGDGHTVTYQAQFSASSQNIGLFGSVSGTIKNLTLNASVTISDGGTNWVNVGLLCGTLTGTLENCHATNCNINSVIATNNGHGISVGLLVGKMSNGTLKYSSGVGNVTGNGRVGGLVGEAEGREILGCSFIGEVVAVAVGDKDKPDAAGGICGEGGKNTTINLCYVNADITATDVACGIVCKSNQSPTVTNCYAAGTVNGMNASNSFEITNSNNNSNNWYDDQINGNTVTPESIAGTLNNAANSDPNINFGVAGDEVIFGVVSTTKVCETPTNLTITNNAGVFTASWTSANANSTITESHWHWSLTGGDAYDSIGDASSVSSPVSVNLGTLPASSTPYTFMVYTDCSETVNGLTSSAFSQQFPVACPTPTNLTASNITDNGFKISWTANVDCQFTVNGNTDIISAGNPMEKTITGLEPQTQYTVTVKAKCGNEYVEQATTNVTTARLAAPTGLRVTTSWNGNAGNNGGSATISWTTIEGLTYEVNTENNTQTSPYQINTLPQGSYTAKVRAKKGNKYSDWASIPYTVSTPNAPSTPQISFAHQGNGTADVTITWEAGSDDSPTWSIKEGETQLATGLSSATYTISGRSVGSSFTIKISETTTAGTSRPLLVNVTVPCADATLPESIETNQTTATFTFASEQPNRKIVIGSTEHDASSASEILSNLSSGTNYNYTIREYCTATLYSEVSSTFVTKSCYAVTGLQAQATGVTSGSASWTSQSELSGLNYKVRLLQGVNEISSTEQTETSITFSELQPSTTYTVEVSEQCGTEGNWGEEKTIIFTTQGAKTYISAKTGNFSDGATWIGGQIPSIGASETASITINAGHIVTLDITFVLRDNITFTNNGVLSIGQTGELINTTNNNVGGIVEVVTPIKAINKWTFIGAPFINGYTLGTILPVSGSDISISKYNYLHGEWNSTWEDVESTMDAGEGYFAWPFYGGVVTYTTYGDLWDYTGDSLGSYDFNKEPATELNNADIIDVNETLKEEQTHGGYWMALSNPYPFKLKVATFLADNILSEHNPEPNSNNVIQGEVIYKFNGTSWTTHNSGDINMTEGFFVNFTNGGAKTATFKKTQRLENQAKSSRTPREFVKLALIDGKKEVDLLFAHNQEAEQNYDIFDANKMFSPVEVAEPYFVTEGIALVKEEVKELPYYATMNVRSFADDTISFVVNNIPEGISVFLIDNEEEIKMSEDVAYTTHISEGENADRFQVLFKKASVIEEAKDSEITITNTNRLVRVESTQTDLRIEVYNALGQKVFATNDYNFTLNEVSAGTYMIKAYNRITTQTAKIVVE